MPGGQGGFVWREARWHLGDNVQFPRRSLLVELFIFLGDCEVQAKRQSWGNQCGANGLVQKREFGAQKLKTWLVASAPFLHLE